MKRWLYLMTTAGTFGTALAWCWHCLSPAYIVGLRTTTPPPTNHGPPPLPPEIVLRETTYDFGSVDQEQTDACRFEIANRGPGQLQLRLTDMACGCTKARINGLDWHPASAQPVIVESHKSSTLEITVKTQRRIGPFRTSATLETNDPRHRQLKLFIQGEIVPHIELSQQPVRFTSARCATPSIAPLDIYSRIHEDLQITSVQSSNPLVTLTLARADSLRFAKSGYRGEVRLAPGLTIGPLEATLTIRTNCPERPEVIVSVLGQIEGPVSLLPSNQMDFRAVKAGQATYHSIFLRTNTDTPAALEISSLSPPFLRTSLHRVSSRGDLWVLKAEVPCNAPQGPFQGIIELSTNHPDANLIRIPVRGDVMDEAQLNLMNSLRPNRCCP